VTDSARAKGSIGVVGALSIGVGGIVGGGFFVTFGITIEGARGGTPVAFVTGGAIALVTAYSYIGHAPLSRTRWHECVPAFVRPPSRPTCPTKTPPLTVVSFGCNGLP
jgi:hypothetical protein